jgi:hypothetical protein
LQKKQDVSVLQTNGSGVLSFASAGGGVLASYYVEKTDTFTTSSTSYVDITTLTLTLTPASASSKFLIFARVSGALWTAGHQNFRLMRNSTAIHVADAYSSAPRTSSSGGTLFEWSTADHIMIHRDSPSTTASTTYKIQCYAEYQTLYVNRSSRDNGTSSDSRTASSLTVLELAV